MQGMCIYVKNQQTHLLPHKIPMFYRFVPLFSQRGRVFLRHPVNNMESAKAKKQWHKPPVSIVRENSLDPIQAHSKFQTGNEIWPTVSGKYWSKMNRVSQKYCSAYV